MTVFSRMGDARAEHSAFAGAVGRWLNPATACRWCSSSEPPLFSGSHLGHHGRPLQRRKTVSRLTNRWRGCCR
jgi:hypothetical protein